MVKGEAQAHHGARHNGAFAHHGLFHHAAHAQDARFAGLEYGGKEVHHRMGHVGNGKGAAGHVVGAESTVAGPPGQFAGGLGDLQQAHFMSIVQHGHHEAFGQGHGHAHVHLAVPGNNVVGQGGVHARVLEQRAGYSQDEHVVHGKAEALVPLEARLEIGNELHAGGHVGFRHQGELGAVLQAALHVVGNDLAHALQGHAAGTFGRFGRSCGGSGGEFFGMEHALHVLAHDLAAFARAGEGSNVQTGLGGHHGSQGGDFDFARQFVAGLHIALKDAALGARAADAGQVHAQFARQPPRGGRSQPSPARAWGLRGGFGRAFLARFRRGGRGFSGSGKRSALHPGGTFARFGQNAHNRLHGRILACRNYDLEKHAVGGAFHLVGNLVRFHFKKAVALLNRGAFGHEPFGNLAGLHGQTEFRHGKFNAHCSLLLR